MGARETGTRIVSLGVLLRKTGHRLSPVLLIKRDQTFSSSGPVAGRD